MRIKTIAQAIQELYYNGRPTVSKRLDKRDFLQFAKMAHGSIMRKMYYEERQLRQHNWYFGDQLEEKKFDLSEPNSKRERTITIKSDKKEDGLNGVLKLPHGLGIFVIKPVCEDGDCPDIIRSEPGSEWLYTGKAFEGQVFWSQRSSKVVIFNLDTCIKEVEVIGIWNDDDIDIPSDVAFDIVLMVMSLTLKVINVPVDRNNDEDPNTKAIKSVLSTP